jgi:hypothetical protein
MKNTLLLASLAVGFVLPVVVHADAPASKTKNNDKVVAATMKPAAAKLHETDYISKQVATGSHIPTVWRSYNGHLDNPSNLRVYKASDLDRAGQLDVASELSLVDTSISNTRGR